jgi:hypothetical protein
VVAPDVEEGKSWGCAVLDKREDLKTVRRYGTFTLLRVKGLECAGHVAWMDDSRIPPKSNEKYVEKPTKGWKNAVGRDVVELASIRNRNAAARSREYWRKEIGEAMAQERAETPQEEEDEKDEDDEKKKMKKTKKKKKKSARREFLVNQSCPRNI